MNKYETHLKGYGHGLPEGNRLPDILKMIRTIPTAPLSARTTKTALME